MGDFTAETAVDTAVIVVCFVGAVEVCVEGCAGPILASTLGSVLCNASCFDREAFMEMEFLS